MLSKLLYNKTASMLKRILSSTFVIYDTEYTAWEGSRENNWKRSGEYREIIEIGAVRALLSSNRIIVKEEFNVLVKPIINPKLSPYITKLCGISQEMIDKKGVYFDIAWEKLLKFTKGAGKALSFGEDNLILEENHIFNNIDFTVNKKYWLNYKKLFIKQSKLKWTDSMQSCDIPRALGIKPVRKQKHRALSDVFFQIQGLNEIFCKFKK